MARAKPLIYNDPTHTVTERRLRNGRSQSAIAKRLGITYQAYQRLENPRQCNPRLKTLEKIAEVMGKRVEVAFS